MDLSIPSPDETVRKIEDIIDIQKANGNLNVRQVAFNLPSESDSTVSANLVKSLDSGLIKSTQKVTKKKTKKSRSKRRKSFMPDVISWPSDSDITVLRMKLCMTSNDLIDSIPGDGLHQPDSSSMINLATLVMQSQQHSKHSIEEFLLPLTSWEPEQNNESETKEVIAEKESDIQFNQDVHVYEALCSHQRSACNGKLDSKDSGVFSKSNKKSKVARFLRLYFCPCCTCLYKIENMRDDPSSYFTEQKESKELCKI